MPVRIARKPIAKDRRRRRWHSTDPHYACYPNTNRPILNFPSDFCSPSTKVQEEPDPNRMDDSDRHEIIDGVEIVIPSAEEQQEHEEYLKKRARESRGFSSRLKDKFQGTHDESTSCSPKASAHSVSSSRPSSSSSSSQQRSTSQASVAMPRSQDRDTRQSESYQRPSRSSTAQLTAQLTAQFNAAYTAKVNKMTSYFQREVETATQERDEKKQRIEHLNSEILARDAQIRALKQTISRSRTGNPDVVPDNQINTDYQYLISQVKNWTLSNFRGSKPAQTEQTITDFGLNVETFPNTFPIANKFLNDSGGRKYLAINMLVMNYLGRGVFEPFLFGLDKAEETFFHDLASNFSKTSSRKEVNFWRSTTVKMMAATESHKDKIVQRKKEILAELESILVNTLPSSVSPANTTRRIENLRTIIDQAVDLSLVLRAQRPTYYMLSLQPGKPFHEYIMDPIGDDGNDDSDDEAGNGRRRRPGKILLSIFPALIKSGNEDGEKYDEKICIHKGKALKA